MIGGIDLGGTKIEARLFDEAGGETLESRRVPTPLDSFASMMTALCDQIDWLRYRAGRADLPTGVAIPGLLDPVTGISFVANIPAQGRSVRDALSARFGQAIPVANDCMAFAYSEARGGAAQDARTVVGLILGTGVGAGLCIDGAIPHRHGGLPVEIGHLGASARMVARHGLPLIPCGCGRAGCLERYISGTGISALAEHITGTRIEASDLAASPHAEEVLAVWADLAGECLDALQITLDPDCIVLGGGLSNLPGIERRLSDALARGRLGPARAPAIRLARFGATSGARGAALLAREAQC